LVVALVLGPRNEHGRLAMLAHNVPFVILGSALLWFGWFGFNGGSALEANAQGVLAFVNTMLAPMATLVVWMLTDMLRDKRANAVGAATAVVVGLVAITPAAGFVSPLSAILIGAIATFPSYFAIQMKHKWALDDSLDVFAGHGLGGIAGALLTGVFANSAWGGSATGGATQLGIQFAAVLAAAAYSAIASFALIKLVGAFMALRPQAQEEGLGLDISQHGEEAYSTGEGAILILSRKKAG
ncbi:MAG: ammonium transporter, partial [Candidatus Eremiobacteraeota bacterium]|nr:ammonium transporter [Candidatus Eremiobacteraeota bacterium]